MAKAPKPNGCHNCRFIDKSEGSKRDGPWSCTYVVQLPPLPLALQQSIRMETQISRWTRGQGMWKDDGEGCPVWAAVEMEQTT